MKATYGATILRRLAPSKRVAIACAILGVLALVGVFAELFAAPAPIFAFGAKGTFVLPAVRHPELYETRPAIDVWRDFEGEKALWPIVRHGPLARSEAGPLAAPSREHPFGTDAQGRDVAARLVYGARTALGLALAAVLASMVLGVVLGGLAGIGRGFWNDRLVRLVETVDTFPAIIVVALVRAIERHPSSLSLVLAVAAVRWAEVARLVRAETLRESATEYALAARALGATRFRVFYRHVLPSVVGPVVVSSVFGVGAVVLLEAAVSFLAMGSPLATSSWGETIAEGARWPHAGLLVLLPGLALLFTVGATYLLADALRDALDPRAVRPGAAASGASENAGT